MENENADHPLCDKYQQVPSSTHQYVKVKDELVSPQPVLTTVTKQAEISPTDKFVSARKVNLAVNQVPYSVSHLSGHDLPQTGDVKDSGSTTVTNHGHLHGFSQDNSSHLPEDAKLANTTPTEGVFSEQVGG